MRTPSLDNFQVVPEEIIEYCAAQTQMIGEDNTFKEILDAGKMFRKAGLTPIFMCSNTLQDVFVTTKEKLQKKLH